MDLVTIFTACALGFKAELFVPLGALDNCSASFGLGATVAPQNGSPTIEQMGSLYRGGSPAVRPAGSVGACRDAGRKPRRRRRYVSRRRHRFDADHAGHIRRTASAVWARCECLRSTRQHHRRHRIHERDDRAVRRPELSRRLQCRSRSAGRSSAAWPPVARRDAAVSGANRRAAGGSAPARRSAGSPISPLRDRCFERAEIEPADDQRQRVCAAHDRRSDRRAAASAPKEDRSPERALCAEVEQSLCNAGTLDQAAERLQISALDSRCSFRSGAIQCGSRLIPLPVTRSSRG